MMYDVVVIGGGSSGMSAAIKASEHCKKVLLIERENRLGGILNQCIHNGFGLKMFKEELTGVEYATKLASQLLKTDVDILLETFVCEVGKDYVVVKNQKGISKIKTKAIVFAVGCREKTPSSISLAGKRLAGVYTAGVVQKMINYYGKVPGKSAVILGSGDIGLIMARRLTLQGVKVKCVLEIMPQCAGLRRNVTQCLDDFSIPLLLSHTVKRVVGEDRVRGVYISKVDENFNFTSEEKFIKCDCLLLAVGLVPENELIANLCQINPKTKGAVVNELRQTSCPSIFSSGNVLHIHDLADNASIEGEIAGESAGLFACGKPKNKGEFDICFSEDISYTIPQKHTGSKNFMLYFRSKKRFDKKKVVVKDENGKIINSKYYLAILPGELQEIEVKTPCGKIFLEVE